MLDLWVRLLYLTSWSNDWPYWRRLILHPSVCWLHEPLSFIQRYQLMPVAWREWNWLSQVMSPKTITTWKGRRPDHRSIILYEHEYSNALFTSNKIAHQWKKYNRVSIWPYHWPFFCILKLGPIWPCDPLAVFTQYFMQTEETNLNQKQSSWACLATCKPQAHWSLSVQWHISLDSDIHAHR